MKKILISAIALVAGGTAAFAADLPARTYSKAPAVVAEPVYNWTGFYIGVNGGAAFGTGNNGQAVTSSGAYDPGPFFPGKSLTGGLAGAHAGYNWQVAPTWVLGVEGDFDWTNL